MGQTKSGRRVRGEGGSEAGSRRALSVALRAPAFTMHELRSSRFEERSDMLRLSLKGTLWLVCCQRAVQGRLGETRRDSSGRGLQQWPRGQTDGDGRGDPRGGER